MMTEIALNILDVAQNSLRAGADLVDIKVVTDSVLDRLTIQIKDNGCGMSPEQLSHVTDPFFTTRTTRKVGLGVPFFKMAAENTGGSFDIQSQEGQGTITTAVFGLSHIDRMPLGDLAAAIHTLIVFNTQTEFTFTYQVDGRKFQLDTREFKEILGPVPLDEPEVSAYIKEFLYENKQEVDKDMVI